MKKVTFVLFFALLAGAASAQPFERGTNMVNLGIGLGSNLGGLGSGRPAISASYERGVWDIGGPGVISLGGYVGNTGYKYDGIFSGSYGYTQKWNYTIVGVRGAYHYNGFTDVPQLDLYGGVMLSYNVVSYSYKDNSGGSIPGTAPNAYGSGTGFSGFIGGRWMFADKFGAFAELGYGISTLNIGLSIKF